MVRARDLERFVDNLPESFHLRSQKKRGASTKAERIERAGKDMKGCWIGGQPK